MISNKLKLLSTVAILILSANALCQQANVTKKLDDGSLIIEFGGQKYRAITDDQMKALDKVQLERDAYKKDLVDADKQIATLTDEKEKLTAKVGFTEMQRDDARRNLSDARIFIAQQKQLLDTATQLSKDTAQFVPHASGNGFAAKLLDFFDRPAVQAGFKIVIPIAGLLKPTRCVP